MSYVQSAFAIIADIFLTLSPVAVLWNVKISLNKKLAICGLMSLGLIATVANAIRNVFIPSLTEDDLTCKSSSAQPRLASKQSQEARTLTAQ